MTDPRANSFSLETQPLPLGFGGMMVRAQRRHQARWATADGAQHGGVAPSDVPAPDVAARRTTSVLRSAPPITASR